MNLSKLGLRKAAILVTALDQAAADSLLDQLPPDQAQRVRDLVVDLDNVNVDEQRRVIDEFFRVKPLVPDQSPPGIELDGSLARRFAMGPGGLGIDRTSGVEYVPSRNDGPPFQFLHETETDKLARVLAGERPQTIALVLSHLPPGRAAGVLARLQPALQTDIVRRLVDLEETDPEILREVEQALESRLSQQVQMQRRRVAGLEAVAGILDATDHRTGARILDNLAAHDRSLAERLGPRPVHFEELLDWDDGPLAAVFDAAGPELTAPALLGAEPEFVERVLGLFPASQSEPMRRRLECPGPIRLRDVEDARQRIAQMASRREYRNVQSSMTTAPYSRLPHSPLPTAP